MSFPLELTDRYAHTFLDFWRLRPRRFLAVKGSTPESYLSPYQFLIISLGLMFSMLVLAFTLSLSAAQTDHGTQAASDPKALAGRIIVFNVVMLGLGTFFETFCSRPWPVRRRPTIVEVFEFNCYLLAVLMPLAAVDVLIDPVLVGLAAQNVIPEWSVFLPWAFGFLVGTLYWFVYVIPGLAFINGVSSSRMAAGLIMWAAVVGFVIGFVPAFIIGFWRGLHGTGS